MDIPIMQVISTGKVIDAGVRPRTLLFLQAINPTPALALTVVSPLCAGVDRLLRSPDWSLCHIYIALRFTTTPQLTLLKQSLLSASVWLRLF